MKDTPILMCGEMVRATLEDRKTNTRRVIMPQPPLATENQKVSWQYWPDREAWVPSGILVGFTDEMRRGIRCPYGAVGTKLWVRESIYYCDQHFNYYYAADNKGVGQERFNQLMASKYRERNIPSIHCYRFASRLTLEITDIKVERVQDISGEDAQAEGWPRAQELFPGTNTNFKARAWYEKLWDSLNKERGFGWDVNPYVWSIHFKRI